MRLIARRHLRAYWTKHPDAETSLRRWVRTTEAARWTSINDIQQAFSKAKAIDAERVRFEIAGGRHRLIAAFDFKRQIAFVKFVGTHQEYDQIDVRTVSQF